VHRGKEADLSLLQREGRPEEDVQQSVSFVWVLLGVGNEKKVVPSVTKYPDLLALPLPQPATRLLFSLVSVLAMVGVGHGAGPLAQLPIVN
jgi:hypothetical protein